MNWRQSASLASVFAVGTLLLIATSARVASNLAAVVGARAVLASQAEVGDFYGNDSEVEMASTTVRLLARWAPGNSQVALWNGVDLLRSDELAEAVPLLRTATVQRPNDVFANYTLARTLDANGDFAEAAMRYAQFPSAYDSTARFLHLVPEVVAQLDLAQSSNIEQWLRRTISIDPRNLWAKVLLVHLGFEPDAYGIAAFKELSFEQLWPADNSERQLLADTIRRAIADSLLHSDYALQIRTFWSALGEGELALIFSDADPLPADVAITPASTLSPGTLKPPASNPEICAGWTITRRYSRPDGTGDARYANSEFAAFTVENEGRQGCWLQGLWTKTESDRLDPSIVAQRKTVLQSGEKYEISFRYRTLSMPPAFRLTAGLSNHGTATNTDGTSVGLAPSTTPALCQANIVAVPNGGEMVLSIRLWSAGAVIIDDFQIVRMSETDEPQSENQFRCQILS